MTVSSYLRWGLHFCKKKPLTEYTNRQPIEDILHTDNIPLGSHRLACLPNVPHICIPVRSGRILAGSWDKHYQRVTLNDLTTFNVLNCSRSSEQKFLALPAQNAGLLYIQGKKNTQNLSIKSEERYLLGYASMGRLPIYKQSDCKLRDTVLSILTWQISLCHLGSGLHHI